MTYESDNPQFDHLINNMDSDEIFSPRFWNTPDYCSEEKSEHRHWWEDGSAQADESRPIEIDPMTGAEVYTDTGDPVYGFPYTKPKPKDVLEQCHWCGRTRLKESK